MLANTTFSMRKWEHLPIGSVEVLRMPPHWPHHLLYIVDENSQHPLTFSDSCQVFGNLLHVLTLLGPVMMYVTS